MIKSIIFNCFFYLLLASGCNSKIQDINIILEGNSSPGLTIIQRTHGGLKKFYDLANDYIKNNNKNKEGNRKVGC